MFMSFSRGQASLEYLLVLLIGITAVGIAMTYVKEGMYGPNGVSEAASALEAKSMAEQLARVLDKAAACDVGTRFVVRIKGRPGTAPGSYTVSVEPTGQHDEYYVIVEGNGVKGVAKFYSFGKDVVVENATVPGVVEVSVVEGPELVIRNV
ncbi:hypothetical protein [Methanopyrus sp.]